MAEQTATDSNPQSSSSAADYFNLAGKVALVTGASSGLGRHFATVLAGAGCTVGLAARREDRLNELVADIESTGGKAFPVPMDVTDRDSIETGIDTLTASAGPISVLINNAGIAVTQNFIDAEDEDTERVFGVNQLAVWQVAQSVCRRMREHTGGSVINIASVGGLRQFSGAASYLVSKAAVVQMTKVMALELARHGIRVNAIAPGYFATEMNSDYLSSDAGLKMLQRSPMRRAGELAELDGPLLLLASDRGSFMTGAIIPVDGGHLVSAL